MERLILPYGKTDDLPSDVATMVLTNGSTLRTYGRTYVDFAYVGCGSYVSYRAREFKISRSGFGRAVIA